MDRQRGFSLFKQYWHWMALAVVLLGAAIIRARLLSVPLERDEGEYAYAGQLILQGIAPYAQVYNMKLPGIYAAYALIMGLFGESRSAIHLGLLIANTATTVLVFLLGRQVVNSFAGLTAAAIFAVLSLGMQVQGIFANAEHFVLLPAMGGLLLLVRAIEQSKCPALFAASFLLGLSFIVKQHGLLFVALGGIYLLACNMQRRPFDWRGFSISALIFTAGAFLPFALTCVLLLKAGVFEKFWFWTFTYAQEYVSTVPFFAGSKRLLEQLGAMFASAPLIWTLAAIGLIALGWDRKSVFNRPFLLLFLTFSLLSVFPGFYFRPHYFVLMLPALALLAGLGASSMYDLSPHPERSPTRRAAPALLVLAALANGLWQQREFLLFANAEEASRIAYGFNPFPESLEIARFINKNTHEGDRIAVLGSEPQLYFYANRRSATGHIYTYALMEPQPYALAMQQEMIGEIENAEPKYLVFVNVPTSWLVRPQSEGVIFRWVENYTRRHYVLEGIADIWQDSTHYVWGEAARSYRPRSSLSIFVFKLKS